MSENNETFEVMYNDCYGGFIIRDEIIAEYIQLTNNKSDFPYRNINRNDKIMIELYHKYNGNINGKYADIKIKNILNKYEKYYYITEYDGLEEIKINYDKYNYDITQNMLDKIKNIIKDQNISNDDKINLVLSEFL